MKKMIGMILVAAMLFSAFACGEAMDERLLDTFERCRGAIGAIAQGNFVGAVQCLNVSSLMSDRLKTIVKAKCPSLVGSVPELTYGVAWVENGEWYLSIPVVEPNYKSAPCMIFKLDSDYRVFSADFTDWADVSYRYAQSPVIKWNVEYIPDYVVMVD